MSIQGEIDRLSAAKTAIASALETMGIEPPEGTTLDQYAAQLTAIAASAPWLDKSTYDPQNKAQDVFGYVDSVAEGLIEYVDFTVTDEPLNGGYRAISNKTFDEVVALLKAGKTVIGRVVQKRGDSFYYLTLTIGQAIDMGEGQLQNICFSSYFDDSIKSNSTTIIMDETFSVYKGYSALHIPEPDDTADNGKVLMASNSEGVWSPMPTAGELGAVPISGGTMTGPLTLSGDPAEDLQAAPKRYVDNALNDITPAGIGAAPASHTHEATDITSGVLPVANGGTGAATFASGYALIGAGTGAVTTRIIRDNTSTSDVMAYDIALITSRTLCYAINRATSVAAANTAYTTLIARGSSLNSAETTPAVNGAIAWTYE